MDLLIWLISLYHKHMHIYTLFGILIHQHLNSWSKKVAADTKKLGHQIRYMISRYMYMLTSPPKK